MKTNPSAWCAASLLAAVCGAATAAVPPQYSIVDLGVIGTATASQAFGVSQNGATVVGRSVGSTATAYSWTAGGGLVALSNLAGRNFAQAYAVNNAGLVVGVSTTTSFGSGALPMVWSNGVGTQLVMPAGQTVGRAYAVNNAGTAVGSVNAGVSERAVIYSGGGASVITATTANGSFMTTAYGINDAGLVIGNGIDPSNAAVNVGLVYDSVSGTMRSLGALPGANGALAFGVSNSGFVVGSSMLNQGSGLPYIWSAAGGMTAIPLPAGTSQASARAVNAAGWAVGTASSAFAIPFLYADGATYSLASLLPAGSGWDFSTNTSASALGISDNGSIVGTAVHNGATHAYVLVAVPEPASWALMLAGFAAVGATARQRRQRPA